MAEFKNVRGMRDFLSSEAEQLRNVEAKAREVARLYGYDEIVTPVVESFELLSAKAGEEVKSRMFAFKDLGGRDVALRPEFTASVARLVAKTLRNLPRPFRLFSAGTVYRYDEPQRGRYREFWQTNYELMGSSRPEADAEILLLTNNLMRSVGLQHFAFKVGHVGVLRGILSQEGLLDAVQATVMQLMDKQQYEDAFNLVENAGASNQCVRTLRRLVEQKGSEIESVVNSVAQLVGAYEKSVAAANNLGEILGLVSKSGLNVDVTVDAGFARGLEYYTGMIFEVYVPCLDVALGGGGRYDKLIELFGGDPTPAVGVAHGLDRIMLAVKEHKGESKVREHRTVMVIPAREELRSEAFIIAQQLRERGVPVEVEVMGRKMAKALEDADRRGIAYAVIVGEKELMENSVVVRSLAKREQKTVKIEHVAEAVKTQK